MASERNVTQFENSGVLLFFSASPLLKLQCREPKLSSGACSSYWCNAAPLILELSCRMSRKSHFWYTTKYLCSWLLCDLQLQNMLFHYFYTTISQWNSRKPRLVLVPMIPDDLEIFRIRSCGVFTWHYTSPNHQKFGSMTFFWGVLCQLIILKNIQAFVGHSNITNGSSRQRFFFFLFFFFKQKDCKNVKHQTDKVLN